MPGQQFSTTSVFVRGLGPDTTMDQLSQTFAKFGTVLPSTKVIAHKGFAFVDFDSAAAATKALAATGLQIGGAAVTAEKRVVQSPSVYVSPISPGVTEDTLRDVFSTLVGNPVSIRFGSKPNQEGVNYAFIEFSSEAEVNTALANTGIEMSGGAPLKIEQVKRSAKPRMNNGRAAPRQQQQQQQQQTGRVAGQPQRAPRPKEPQANPAAAPRAPKPASSEPKAPKPPTGVYIKTLPEGVTVDEIKAAFAPFGRVIKVDLRNLDNYKAFVTFSTSAITEQACNAAREGKHGELKVFPARGRSEVAHVTGFTSAPVEQNLIQTFGLYGPVSDVKIVPPRSFCIVTFDKPEAMEAALKGKVQLKGVELELAASVRQTKAPRRRQGPRPPTQQ